MSATTTESRQPAPADSKRRKKPGRSLCAGHRYRVKGRVSADRRSSHYACRGVIAGGYKRAGHGSQGLASRSDRYHVIRHRGMYPFSRTSPVSASITTRTFGPSAQAFDMTSQSTSIDGTHFHRAAALKHRASLGQLRRLRQLRGPHDEVASHRVIAAESRNRQPFCRSP